MTISLGLSRECSLTGTLRNLDFARCQINGFARSRNANGLRGAQARWGRTGASTVIHHLIDDHGVDVYFLSVQMIRRRACLYAQGWSGGWVDLASPCRGQ